MRILHIFGRMNPGGAEMRTLDMMRYVDQGRYQLHFCTLSGLPGTLDEEICLLGGEIHPCRLDLSFSPRFRRLIRAKRFDAIHSHVHLFSGYILRLAAKEGIQIRISHFRGTRDDHGNSIRRIVQRRLMRRMIDKYATNILAVSEDAMRKAWSPSWRVDPRCEVIYNGLDLSRFGDPPDRTGVRREFQLPEACPLIIHVGRFDSPKNHLRLVDIFTRTAGLMPEVRFLLVGRGGNEIEQRVRNRIEEVGLSDHIVLAGERRDVPRLLKAADLMVFPSSWEGLPGVVLEACGAGLPVLASNLPGVREIEAHFPLVHCLSLDSDDDGTWAGTVVSLLKDADGTRSQHGSEKLFKESPFDIRECVRRHCAVWNGDHCPVSRKG